MLVVVVKVVVVRTVVSGVKDCWDRMWISGGNHGQHSEDGGGVL